MTMTDTQQQSDQPVVTAEIDLKQIMQMIPLRPRTTLITLSIIRKGYRCGIICMICFRSISAVTTG